ncbi:MAG: hypothetical protein ACI9QL_005054 [Candidatus Omnitrophota bacterium]|jgi:hypothetical protein
MYTLQRFILIAALGFGVVLNGQEDALSSASRTYQQSADTVMAEYWTVLLGAREIYTKDLEFAKLAGKTAGNLDQVLKADAALKLFDEARTVISHEDPAYTTAVRKAAYNYGLKMNEADKKQTATLNHIKGQYVQHLTGLKRTYTQQGRIEDAMKAKAVIDLLTAAPEPAPVVEEVVQVPPLSPDNRLPNLVRLSKEWPCSKEGLIFMWENLNRGDIWIDPRITDNPSFTLTPKDNNQLRTDALVCQGGRTVVDGANTYLLQACQQTNELTIEAMIKPENVRQSGPARIISFSKDGDSRNFSICQEQNEFSLRLRTTETGLNGINPEVRLGELEADTWHHLIVSYREGELTCMIDGVIQVVKQITGDFSNWSGDQQQLLFGNEYLQDRPWNGELKNIAIYARFIDVREAQFRHKVSSRVDRGPKRKGGRDQ